MARSDMSVSSSNSGSKKPRTPQSCDRCKSRKTKCVDPVPGPCKYCAHIGVECSGTDRQKKRPYYHVTEEEYRCCIKILRHLLPGQDLSLESLRRIAEELDRGAGHEQTPVLNTPNVTMNEDEKNEHERQSEEIGDLNKQLGCMMEDSLGEYRYIGPYSDIAFNDAVCTIKSSMNLEKQDTRIILPPRRAAYPPEKPKRIKPPDGSTVLGNPYLPPRDSCAYYVKRFFADVNSTYWLYPYKQFQTRLDRTYADGGATSSSAWLCSLYGIFALGAASVHGQNSVLFDPPITHMDPTFSDTKSFQDYLSLAKGLAPSTQDEASVDSIRAFTILGIILENFGFRIGSYIYIGSAIRIAFSLGLQYDKGPASQSLATRQQNRRIWWTLYVLDQEISLLCGSPFMIDGRVLRIQTPAPLEQVFDPGPATPLGFVSASMLICRLKREIIQATYPERSADSRSISFSKTMSLLSSVQKWHTSLPSHLKLGAPLPPEHKRAVGILHLHYWDATILLTRAFLLYLVLRGPKLSQTKKEWFEKLSDICIDAAKNALPVLKGMSAERSLSSLITFDTSFILKISMVFVLALGKTGSLEYQIAMEECFMIVQAMEPVGFCALVIQELPVRLAEIGLIVRDNSVQNYDGLQNFSFMDFVGNLTDVYSDLGQSYMADMDMFMNMNMSQIPSLDEFEPNIGF
ncbi:hypothetical protein F5884DRAFT_770330 [Xylogone sp. PMI_703]|nr:hypothetical protein F5884DRAFT_770330 [Xylogone sp. PMI_703]